MLAVEHHGLNVNGGWPMWIFKGRYNNNSLEQEKADRRLMSRSWPLNNHWQPGNSKKVTRSTKHTRIWSSPLCIIQSVLNTKPTVQQTLNESLYINKNSFETYNCWPMKINKPFSDISRVTSHTLASALLSSPEQWITDILASCQGLAS